MSIKAQVSIASKLGLTSHQNAVALLRELVLHNESNQSFQDLTLQLHTNPAVLEEKQWHIDCLLPGSSLDIHDRDLKLNIEWLVGLTESVACEATLSLRQGSEELLTQNFPLQALAKNEWGGEAMLELLPSFIMPDDPAIAHLLKATSDVLRSAGKSDSLEGYQNQSRTRVWEMVSALWTAVCTLNISYTLPPASFERNGQKIRTPGDVLDGKVATCLDLTLLFASALEQMQLNPLVFLIDGHAFVGCWLQPHKFAQLITEDVSSVRNRIDLKEIVAFETALVTEATPPMFSLAVESARDHLSEETFHAAIDIQRARMQKILPLALMNMAHFSHRPATALTRQHGFEDAPQLPSFMLDVEPECEIQAANRLALWQRKLLDLTTRNRLLHLPESAKCIRLLCANPGLLEVKLSEGKRMPIVALPDLEMGSRDAELYRQQADENYEEEYARQALENGEVVSPLEKERLESTLIDLYRKSISCLEEGGANTLFLAVGFLKWKKSADDPKSFTAPLILLPIQLDRKSALSAVTMRLLEEEPRFNLTLLELLRSNFGVSINGLDDELPTNESGIDVEGIWDRVRHAVRDIPGFEVTRDVVIGTFSFTGYLMWKDLNALRPRLMQSPLVKYLIERGQENAVLEKNGEIVAVDELDSVVDFQDLFLPLPADSSQIAAVAASAKGLDFVLDGPPGTGKSQTIANMIAHNLALGRRVLFVAGKKAALDVVYRRLESQGLGEFCLQLHSSKTSKIDFLKQLERAWDARESFTAGEWEEEARHVQLLRDKLNQMVRLLHLRWPNGLTLHQAIGRVIRDASDITPAFAWPAGTQHDTDQMMEFRDFVRRLELNRDAYKQYGHDFGIITQTEWTNNWQFSLITEAQALTVKIEHLDNIAQKLQKAAEIPLNSSEPEELNQFAALCELLTASAKFDLNFIFAPDATARIEAGQAAMTLLKEIDATKVQLSVTYPENHWQKVNTRQVKTALAEADNKFWFFASRARKKVVAEVVKLCSLSTTPDLAVDLPVIEKLQSLTRQLAEHTSLATTVPGWDALNTNQGRFRISLEAADVIRGTLEDFATAPLQMAKHCANIKAFITRINEVLGFAETIAALTQDLRKALTEFNEIKTQFCQLGNVTLNDVPVAVLGNCAQSIVKYSTELKAWCGWCRIREEATARGLLPLINAISLPASDNISITEMFESAYCRWFASWVIGSEPLLHNFAPAEHQSDIETYRSETDRLAKLTVRYIRAKLCEEIPAKNDIPQQGGFAVLKHELQKSQQHKPVRQMVAEMGNAMAKLAPCMLMSPLSAAQFLPSEQPPFDLVIFDEASQISPWDAIGVMARGKQVVVAGDPRQMSPTRFFNRAATDADNDTEQDMDSILDECLAAGLDKHSLSWHYRSRHESLIAFSNQHYYDSNLITFPAAETKQSAVQWCKVAGVYAGGQNQAEAEAIVAETVKRLTDETFVASGKSIGIITLNTGQQTLISDLLDRARQQHPEIEPFFQAEREEPVVVKNLETAQGDERDLIILGIGYGPTQAGAETMSMNFGPLNREDGWRRLNVALTRARQEMMVFSSFDPSMIDLNRTSAQAVADLKHFIEFAQRGPQTQAVRGATDGDDTPFEDAVANGLRQKGWQVVPRIGISRMRIDLGIVHPDKPDDYLVGIECGGAIDQSATTAQDRYNVRNVILQGLGWKLLRVWATEWWVDKEGALERLDMAINRVLDPSYVANVPEILDLPEVLDVSDVTEVPEVLNVPDVTNEPEILDAPDVTDMPEVLDAPDVTDVPEVLDAPDVTDEPEILEEPDETDEPEILDRPDVTDEPEILDEPDETDMQEILEEPDVTDEPESMDEPDETDMPEVLDVPDVTDMPEVLDEPDEMDEPEILEEPDETDEPEILEEPDEMDLPEVLDEPGVTDMPEILDEPDVTDVPEILDEPDVTDEPEILDEPDETDLPEILDEPDVTDVPITDESARTAFETASVEDDNTELRMEPDNHEIAHEEIVASDQEPLTPTPDTTPGWLLPGLDFALKTSQPGKKGK